MRREETINERVTTEVRSAVEKAGVRKLVVGVSGGADSICLLNVLASLNVDLLAVHCNFHLRGAESDRDAEFVKSYCTQHSIPLETIHFDVEKYRAEHGSSVEMACRTLRYDEFEKIRIRFGADRIAVAHNSDDLAETVLLNLMRGAGVAGLRGMLPDNGKILRPLLRVSRAEIEDYLSENGLTYITDSTNLSSDYRRNFLRNEVIPLLETRWPQAKNSICHTAEIMAQEETILQFAENNLVDGKSDSLPFDLIKQSPDIKWIIRRFARRYDASDRQIEEMSDAIIREPFQSGKLWNVTEGKIVMERDRLQFIPVSCQESEIRIETDHFNADEISYEEIRQSNLDELWTTLSPEQIEFRRAREGDRIKPLGMKGSTLVSKILKDAKRSLAEKQNTIVAEERATGEIIWIKGLKRSRNFLIAPDFQEAYRYRADLK